MTVHRWFREIVQQVLKSAGRHGLQGEGDLKNLFQVVERCGLPVSAIGLKRVGAIIKLVAEHIRVQAEGVQQPAGIHAHHHHKELERQEQVNCLEHFHNFVFRTAIEVIDVKNYSL